MFQDFSYFLKEYVILSCLYLIAQLDIVYRTVRWKDRIYIIIVQQLKLKRQKTNKTEKCTQLHQKVAQRLYKTEWKRTYKHRQKERKY